MRVRRGRGGSSSKCIRGPAVPRSIFCLSPRLLWHSLVVGEPEHDGGFSLLGRRTDQFPSETEGKLSFRGSPGISGTGKKENKMKYDEKDRAVNDIQIMKHNTSQK